MSVRRLALQVGVSVFVTATVLPFVVSKVPLETRATGFGLVGAVFAASFALVWLVWPRRKS
jgi:hypothetical protein